MNIFPTIDMKLETSGGAQVVFRSTTRGRNELTLSLTNAAGNGDLQFLPDSKAALILNFSTLCNAAELDQIKVAAPGWTVRQGPAGNLHPITLAPAKAIRWADGQTLAFQISLGAAGATARLDAKAVTVTLKDLRGADPEDVCASKSLNDFVTLVDEPEHPQNPLRNVLSFKIERVEPKPAEFSNQGEVYTAVGRSYSIPNQLRLTIQPLTGPGSPKAPLKAKSGCTPTFTLVFPTVPMAEGDDVSERYGSTALTTVDLVQQIKVTPHTDADHPWSALGPDAQSLVCEVTPGAGNKELFKAGGALELLIDDVKTRLPAFATQVYVLHSGFDGFDDGYEVLQLRKAVPEPQVVSFLADQTSIYCGDTVSLSWSVLGADKIELSYVAFGATQIRSSARGTPLLGLPLGSLQDLPDENTTYTLSLYKGGHKALDRPVQVDVVMPILELRMTPPAAALDDRVVLSWRLEGRWAFNGVLTEGGYEVQKITKPAGPLLLEGSTTMTVSTNRHYHLAGEWDSQEPKLRMEADATLSVVEPEPSLTLARMYGQLDRAFGDLAFRWAGRHLTNFAIGHCEKGTAVSLDGVSTLPGEGRQLSDVFTIVEIESGIYWGIAVPLVHFVPWPDDQEPTLDWCNAWIAQRDFYVLAWGERGTSALPLFRKAEAVSRDHEL